MAQNSEAIVVCAVDLQKFLGIPTFGTFGVREDTHEYNGHVHNNMDKACSYEQPCSAWVGHPIDGCWCQVSSLGVHQFDYLGYPSYPFYLSPYLVSSNFGDWLYSAVKTLEPEGAVAARVEDAWEDTTLIPEGRECSEVQRYKMVKGKWSSRQVEYQLDITSTDVDG